jgi:hypothetical protein
MPRQASSNVTTTSLAFHMKRDLSPDSVEPATKRLKNGAANGHDLVADPDVQPTADDPFRRTLQRKAVDICEHGTDEEGFIQFKVKMKWPPKPHRIMINATAVEDGQDISFDIALHGSCAEYVREMNVTFDLQDTLYLSLRGVQLEKTSSAIAKKLPMVLNYTEGVCLKFLSKKGPPPKTGMIVDYWACNCFRFLSYRISG